MRKLLPVVLIIFLFTSAQCKKDKPEPQLPPATTVGAMTFGCKINGKVFPPRDGNGHTGLFVQYVNLGNVPDGGWHLNIPAYDYKDRRGITIQTDSLLLVEGVTYAFKEPEKGHPLIFYEEVKNGGTDVYGKLNSDSGYLYVTKHDQINHILSGTFYFTGTKLATGEKVNVSEGRFDVRN
jgi:hypothetical protein